MSKLSDFRNPQRHKKVVFDMFMEYVASDGFGDLSLEERRETVDCVNELIVVIDGEINDIIEESETE